MEEWLSIDVDSSSDETGSQCTDSEDTDTHVHTKGEFYGCYLLVSKNPKFKGHTYIGFTVDPNRRLKQHNAGHHMGGARKTSGRGPWEMVLIIHGFPNNIAALRFEWAWQHPARSRRLGKGVAKRKSKESPLEYRFRVVTEMLSVGPWNRLPLTIRWLKQEYQLPFPLNKQPPVHMPIAYGLVDITKPRKGQGRGIDHMTDHMVSSPEVTREDEGPTVRDECMLCKQQSILQGSEQDSPCEAFLSCYHSNCSMTAHITCLAERFCAGQEGDPLIPISGDCPLCKQSLLWGEMVRKYNSNSSTISSEPMQDQLSQPPPVKKRKTQQVGPRGSKQKHWTQSLNL